jgi:hypothetical protein
MLEILRRLALAAGTGVFLWLYFWSPAALVAVRPADWGARMLERQFVTQDLTIERLRLDAMEDRTLDPSLAQGITLPEAGRRHFYDASHPAVAPLAQALAGLSRRTHGINAYTTLHGADYEWTIHRQPRKAGAPEEAAFPLRGDAWPWLGGGLLLFLLLPRAGGRGAVRWDPVALLILDLTTILCAAACFGAPLALYDSTAAALSPLGAGTIAAWVASGVALAGLAHNMIRAIWFVQLKDGNLLVRTLWRKRDYPLPDLTRTQVLTRDGIPCGWRFHFRSSPAPLDLPWSDRVNWGPLAEALVKNK